MSNTITTGTLIWLPDLKTVWKSVEVIEYSENLLKYRDIDEVVKTLKLTKPPLLKNPEILIGQNDLTSLSHLHEPAVLHNLYYRFGLGTIYTYCGIVLVAINPYEELDIYNRETILAYRGGGDGLDPHIFAVAEQAFGRMERYEFMNVLE
jgi:myosin-5